MIFDFALARGDIDSATEQRSEVDVYSELTKAAARVVLAGPGATFAAVADTTGVRLWRPNRRVVDMALEANWPVRFLGRSSDGRAEILISVEDVAVAAKHLLPEGVQWMPLLEMAPLLENHAESLLVTQAAALMAWSASGMHCPQCGNGLVLDSAGWTAACSSCAHIEYPRTDPAVIVAVFDPQDRLLLVHNVAWAEKRMSLPAGYVDPGESAERTVVRELREETALAVRDLRYLGSQPWPRPRSLMLAYSARTLKPDPTPDGIEIDRAAFFTREELVDAVQRQSVVLPGPAAIAHSIINTWMKGESF